MKMNNNQGGINAKFNYILLAFFMFLGFQSTFGQKHNYKDYVIENLANEKIAGKVSLNKKFWYSTIYFENKDQGIFEYYYPHQLRSFSKGDSVFIVVRVNYNKFKENGISKRNFALLLDDKSVVKLYKSYVPVENGKIKEIFFYSKEGMKDAPVLIEDNKSSVLSAVSDCNSLKNDINQSSYEYSEPYFKGLFENYSIWSKDTTATLLNVSKTTIVKSDSITTSETSSVDRNVSSTPIAKVDSISLSDTTTNAPLSNVSETTIVKTDSIISSSDASATEKGDSNSQEPLIDGFASGDSLLFEFNGLYPGQFLNHTKNGKGSIQYKGMGGKLKTQTVNLQAVYKTSAHPENKEYFGYEVGDNANIEVFVTKLNTKVLKPCTIVGLNPNRLVISYLTEDGKERVLSVDKGMIKE